MRRTWLDGSKTNAVFGVIFTEFGDGEVSAAVKTIEAKITAGLQKAFKASQLSSFQISFYAFPDGWDGDGHAKPVDSDLYPDLFEVEREQKAIAADKARDGSRRRVLSRCLFCHRCSGAAAII